MNFFERSIRLTSLMWSSSSKIVWSEPIVVLLLEKFRVSCLQKLSSAACVSPYWGFCRTRRHSPAAIPWPWPEKQHPQITSYLCCTVNYEEKMDRKRGFIYVCMLKPEITQIPLYNFKFLSIWHWLLNHGLLFNNNAYFLYVFH